MNSEHIFTDGVRRHADHSIDFDFYRTYAIALRAQARRDAPNIRLVRTGAIAIVTIFTLTIGVMSFIDSIPQTRSVAAHIEPLRIR